MKIQNKIRFVFGLKKMLKKQQIFMHQFFLIVV